MNFAARNERKRFDRTQGQLGSGWSCGEAIGQCHVLLLPPHPMMPAIFLGGGAEKNHPSNDAACNSPFPEKSEQLIF